VLERLAQQGVAAYEREGVLARLREAGYVDDARVARERVGRLLERGYGDEAIRAELGRRGVPQELVSTVLESLEPEPARASRLIARSRDPRAQARALARRGFSEESIEHALADVAQQP
jgi:SOS response regulatory protein OraA/RecX